MKKTVIIGSLFYAGGTLEQKDIIETSSKCRYNIAFNDKYMFMFEKYHNKIVKVVKAEYQTDFTFKIMKSKVKIDKNGFIKIMTSEFWDNVARDAMNNIMKITNGVTNNKE